MRYFAIQHKPTGMFLPQGRARGFTHDIPSNLPPRLFLKRAAAESALRCWLKGEWVNHISGGGGFYGDDYDQWSEPPKEAPADRKPEDMAVVVVDLRVSL